MYKGSITHRVGRLGFINCKLGSMLIRVGKLQFICLIGGRILTWGRRVPASVFACQGSMP